MANRKFEFYVRYIDPEEVERTTPAKREERVAGPYPATTVQRALSQFYTDVADKPFSDATMSEHTRVRASRNILWPKAKIVVVDVMRGKGQAGPQMEM